MGPQPHQMPRGLVKLDGKNITGSNISDHLSNEVRKRCNFNPVGSKEFFLSSVKDQLA